MDLLFKILIIYLITLITESYSSNLIQINSDDNKTYISAGDFEKEFSEQYKLFVQNNKKSNLLNKLLHFLISKHDNELFVLVDIPNATDPVECLRCRALTNTVLEEHRNNLNLKQLTDIAFDLCKTATVLDPQVCRGLIDLNAPIIDFILSHNRNITSASVCDITFQHFGCTVNAAYEDFQINTIDAKPTPLALETISSKFELHDHVNLTIVHITDVHYDPFYKIGGNAVCGQGVCCRNNQGEPSSPGNAAGKWGDYRDCDSPWEAIVDIVQHIKSQYKDIDYIYFTGDIVDHFTWETTMENNINIINKFFDLLRMEFPGVPVFPLIGNHEAHPGNLYPPSNFKGPSSISIQWLYDLLAQDWMHWLPNSTINTIKKEAYYTVLVRPGFRVISLNNNVCYVHNFWLLYDYKVYIEQLQWLHDVLLSAALNNEFVHILGHVPPNDIMCFIGWAREYRKIVEKFSYMITGQFNGHSHNDEFAVYYKNENISQPISVAWNGGSGTPFTQNNPNYKVYQVHPITHEVLECDTWIYNLTEANANPNKAPAWFKEYSFKEAYGMQDLSVKSFDELVNSFATDKAKLTQFWKYKGRQADIQLAAGCDDKCLLGHLCDIVRNQYDDHRKCEELTAIFLKQQHQNQNIL